jgi:hypothetical protein
MQPFNHAVAANVSFALIDQLIDGALIGLAIGILVGALVMPMVQTPDTMLRTVLFAILAAVGMSIFQLARIGRATGERLGTILSAFMGPYTDTLGETILDGVIWVLYAMLGGALIGVGSQVPDRVIKGGLIGLFIGGAVGAALQAILGEINVALSPTIFRITVAVLTWALFTVVVGGEN